mgnify:CR=1 FL=1
MCISQKVRVENMFGLHARPASKLVNLAKENINEKKDKNS